MAFSAIALATLLGKPGGVIEPNASDPSVLTWGLLGLAFLDVWLAATFVINPRRSPVQLRRQAARTGKSFTLVEAGKVLSALGASFALMPGVLAVLLLIISGDLWRLLLFLPVTSVAVVVLWARVGETLEVIARLGPAGPVPPGTS